MAIEIVDFPMKNGGSFHGKMLVHQRVNHLLIGMQLQALQHLQPKEAAELLQKHVLWISLAALF